MKMSMSGSLKSLVTYKPREETSESLSPIKNRSSKSKIDTGIKKTTLSPNIVKKDLPSTTSNFYSNNKVDKLIIPPIKTDNFRNSCLPNKIHQNILYNKNHSYKNEKEILILNKKRNMSYVKNILTTKKGEGMNEEHPLKDDKMLYFKVEDDLIDKYKKQNSHSIRRNHKSGLTSSPSKNTNEQKETDPQTTGNLNAHTFYVSSNSIPPDILGSSWTFESINQQKKSHEYTIQNKEEYYNKLKEYNIRHSTINTVASAIEDSKKKDKNPIKSFISKQKSVNKDDRKHTYKLADVMSYIDSNYTQTINKSTERYNNIHDNSSNLENINISPLIERTINFAASDKYQFYKKDILFKDLAISKYVSKFNDSEFFSEKPRHKKIYVIKDGIIILNHKLIPGKFMEYPTKRVNKN